MDEIHHSPIFNKKRAKMHNDTKANGNSDDLSTSIYTPVNKTRRLFGKTLTRDNEIPPPTATFMTNINNDNGSNFNIPVIDLTANETLFESLTNINNEINLTAEETLFENLKSRDPIFDNGSSSNISEINLIAEETLFENLKSRDPVFKELCSMNENSPEIVDLDPDETCFPDTFVQSCEYWDIGDPSYRCEHCGAMFWYEERLRSTRKSDNPKFSLCCMQGKIQLPAMKEPPEILHDLLHGDSERSKHYNENIRSYNSMFSFTSLGGTIDRSYNDGNSPPVFRINGQNYHSIGSLLPVNGNRPKFAQLYIYDTSNEIQNRIASVRQKKDINTLHAEIVADLKYMLDENNVLVKSFRRIGQRLQEGETGIKLKLIGRRGSDARRYNLPTVSEVAAIIPGDLDPAMGDRDIIVETQTGYLQRINELNASYLPLQYPLLFPFGEDGYREDIPYSDKRTGRTGGRKRVSVREYFAYRLQDRQDEPSTILSSRRLLQQFIVDAYTMVEAGRLKYVVTHQKELRCEMYKGLKDALMNGETDSRTQGRRIILPPSFTGGARFMIQNYQDAMAICRWAGYPNLFITFTCNQKWPEIVRFVEERGLKPEDRPDIISRIFKVKLEALIDDLRKKELFGEVKAVVYTIEFQKRGLPHAHILLFLKKENRDPSGSHIDNIISAEIPNEGTDPDYFAAVRDYMMHGPCGEARKNSPCMSEEGVCTKHFPKKFVSDTTIDEDGYPVYRRRNDGRTIKKNGVELDNRYVVPHNRHLLLKYGAHINVEWCNQSRSIKYLFKYVNKGHDRVTASFYKSTTEDGTGKEVDEVQMYYDCRYISPCEAAWRIFGFDIQYRNPPVERLSFHLQDEQSILFSDSETIDSVVNKPSVRDSMFLGWFEANKKFPEAKKLTYAEFPQYFVWKCDKREWVIRQKGFSIGRICYVPPGSGEAYYLRILLNIVRGPTCYDDFKVYNNVMYETYREVCYAKGLLDDDKEYIDGIQEASQWASAQSMRTLFVTLLSSGNLSRPELVWEKCWTLLSEDILYRQRRIMNYPELHMTDEEIKNLCLFEIEKLLRAIGKCLIDYDGMPKLELDQTFFTQNRLICSELAYNRSELKREHEQLFIKLNDEQRKVYDSIKRSVDSNKGAVFFVYGYGGTGKTYLWRTLSAALRSKGEIVLNVASSGIASLLLPGGRTAHSRFAIPINITEDSTCNIKQGSQLAELLVRCRLIIWDEAPMVHRHCIEALDNTLRDIMQLTNQSSSELPFGGKTTVFGGDFRQILPVIPKGSRQDIVHATINSSYLWDDCTVLRLTKNMRLQNLSSTNEHDELKSFSEWMAAIGDGTIGDENDAGADIEVPNDLLLKHIQDPIGTIVRSTYPDFKNVVGDLNYFKDRAILAPTLEVVDSINDYMIKMNDNEARTYLSSDSVCKSDMNVDILADLHTTEFLNSLKCSGVPNHKLTLKVGTPVMLLRNIDHSRGLCNGTRLVLTRLGDRVLEGRVITGSNSGELVLIPRLSLTPSDPRLPFKFQRRQFPLIVSYAMSINKSQGQSLANVGIYLKKSVFSHGQLYVAVSRVTNRKGLKILVCDDDECSTNKTKNVVFKEVFRNV